MRPELGLGLAAAMSTALHEITPFAGRLEQRSGDSSDLVRLRLYVIGDGSRSCDDDDLVVDEMRDELVLMTA